jgi:hypothetical protein
MPAKTVIDVDGSDAVSSVLLALLNTFPGLSARQSVLFSTLSDTSGIGFFPTTGAAFLSDNEDVTGHVKQVCLYPFSVVYRAAPKTEAQRLRIKEFLDALSKWLERQPVTLNDTECQLAEYPALSSGNRVIKSINRSSPAYLNSAYQDGIEDWIVALRLTYENEFDR